MQLSLHNGSSSGVTIISNIFIDYYMPRANGEFVKIYLYLLRSLQSGDTALDLAAVADVFDCTESDVLRTLRYWENQNWSYWQVPPPRLPLIFYSPWCRIRCKTHWQNRQLLRFRLPHRQTPSHPAHRRQPEHLSHLPGMPRRQALSPLRQQGIKKQ